MSRRSPERRDTLDVFRIPFDGAELPSRETVGSKAFNLMVMARHGLPVPPALVLGTDLCRRYMACGAAALEGLEAILSEELDVISATMGRRFGDRRRSLLVSVRSGAAISMPGMMETVLNVGLSAEAVHGLVRLTGNPRLAYDCRRRLIQQYAEVVHGASASAFDAIVDARLHEEGLKFAHELDTQALSELADATLGQFESATGRRFPEEPIAQLTATVEAVLKSWSSERARSYRRLNHLDDDAGTAVTIQAMVFGNAGPTSGSGVGFTRNPADGSNALYVDYLPNAQGEDVVAGRRNALGTRALERRVPQAYADLSRHKDALERIFEDMQDFEFTVEDGRLYLLQCRSGKRTPLAGLRIAHDLVAEGIITPQTALDRLASIDLADIETAELAPADGTQPIARAVPASAGVAVGAAVLDPTRVDAVKALSKPVILLRRHAETADIEAVSAADGLVTALGARTSHAAVVARQLGKPCLVGCDRLNIDGSLRSCMIGETKVSEGDTISIDAGTGAIYAGAVPIRREKPEALLADVRAWQAHSANGAADEPSAKPQTRRGGKRSRRES